MSGTIAKKIIKKSFNKNLVGVEENEKFEMTHITGKYRGAAHY